MNTSPYNPHVTELMKKPKSTLARSYFQIYKLLPEHETYHPQDIAKLLELLQSIPNYILFELDRWYWQNTLAPELMVTAFSIGHMKHITALILSYVNLTAMKENEPSAMTVFFDTLATNEKIHTLRMSSCHLDDNDALLMAKCLLRNRTLLFVAMGANDRITDAGLLCITRALLVNRTLLSLDIQNVTFTHDFDMNPVKRFIDKIRSPLISCDLCYRGMGITDFLLFGSDPFTVTNVMLYNNVKQTLDDIIRQLKYNQLMSIAVASQDPKHVNLFNISLPNTSDLKRLLDECKKTTWKVTKLTLIKCEIKSYHPSQPVSSRLRQKKLY